MLYIYFDTLWGFLQDMLLSLNSWLVVAVVVIYGYGNLKFEFNWKHKKKQKRGLCCGEKWECACVAQTKQVRNDSAGRGIRLEYNPHSSQEAAISTYWSFNKDDIDYWRYRIRSKKGASNGKGSA